MAASMVRLRRDLPSTAALSRSKSLQMSPSTETGIVVTKDELDRYRELIAAQDQGKTSAARKATERRQMAELARTKREQIVAIDEERIRHQGTETVDPDFAHLEQSRRMKRLQDEDRDEVKGMNSVMLRSRCANVLGAQLQEKKAIAAARAEEDRRLEVAMEVDRLKALKVYEDRDRKRNDDRRKGALVIKAQLEEREAERLNQLEMKHQEQQLMLQHIEKLKADERVIQEQKRDASRQLMQDIAIVNAEQIRMKARQRELEVAEDRRIAEYIKEKDKRETELAEEQERQRAEREREVARLRSMQEKAQDLQSEADAVRAKRLQDSYAREERHKEQERLERAARIERELAEARQQQKREKEEIQREEAMLEQEEYQQLLLQQRLGDAADRRAREEEKQRRLAHQAELKEQLAGIHEQKKLEKRAYLAEGRQQAKDQEVHRKHMQYVRGQKVHQLEEESIPDQFRIHLSRPPKPEPLRPAKK
eukprot:GGOE01062111.1.p1 GENE.GGOE01062111.1~~GGOE01062111.1.p1  ORF type:complete len:506 (+),score=226.15 GGOE01062111.1:78-1520(+)